MAIMSAMSSCRIRNGLQMVSGRLFGRPIRQKMRRTLGISFASTVTLNLRHVSTSSKISFFNYSIFLPMNLWSTALHRHYSKTNLTVELSDEFHRLLIIQPSPKFGRMPKPFVKPADKLEEAVALAEAITGWKVCHQRIENVRNSVNAQHYFGTGKIEELKRDVRDHGDEITGVFINVPKLTPLQYKTCRSIFDREIFDRFGIVLQIFKERAQTKEAKLQVALAALPYQRLRLPEDENRRGRGEEGSSVYEMRKHQLSRRVKQLEEELKEIRSRRQYLRESRARRTNMPIVAVVGYTNAGKTTLIKALSRDSAMVPKDMLFATLDSTHHAGKLPCGLPVLFVDTIGFIADIPVELVESFSATLEDSINADVLVHVIDGSHPLAYAQRKNVMDVLAQLDTKPELTENIFNVVNKIDKIEEECEWEEEDILVSATQGLSMDFLKMKIQEQVLRATGQRLWNIQLPSTGQHLSWLHSSDACLVEVTSPENDDTLQVKVLLTEATLHKFVSKFTDDNITMTTVNEVEAMKITVKNL